MSTDTCATSPLPLEQATNLLLIIDAETLLTHYSQPSLDPQRPTMIEDGFIFSVGASSSGHELIIPLSGTLHLRGRTVGLHAEHSVVLYNLTVGDAGVLEPPQLVVHNQLPLPAPNPETPTEPLTGKANDHYWCCRPLSPGVERCELGFMLVDSNCEVLGYFGWEVEVTVSG